MAVTLASFLASFPEFGGDRAPVDLINAKIATATRWVDPNVWGAKTDDGIMYKAADLLALSPWGQQARLSDDTGSTYGAQYLKMQRSVSPGVMVLGRVRLA